MRVRHPLGAQPTAMTSGRCGPVPPPQTPPGPRAGQVGAGTNSVAAKPS